MLLWSLQKLSLDRCSLYGVCAKIIMDFDELESSLESWEKSSQKKVKGSVIKRDFAQVLEKILSMGHSTYSNTEAALQGDIQIAIDILLVRTVERIIHQKSGFWSHCPESEKKIWVKVVVAVFLDTMHMNDGMATEEGASMLSLATNKVSGRLPDQSKLVYNEMLSIFKDLNAILREKRQNAIHPSLDHPAGDNQQTHPFSHLESLTDRPGDSRHDSYEEPQYASSKEAYNKELRNLCTDSNLAEEERKVKDEIQHFVEQRVPGPLNDKRGPDMIQGIQGLHSETLAVNKGGKMYDRYIAVLGNGELKQADLDMAYKMSEIPDGPAETMYSTNHFQQRIPGKSSKQVSSSNCLSSLTDLESTIHTRIDKFYLKQLMTSISHSFWSSCKWNFLLLFVLTKHSQHWIKAACTSAFSPYLRRGNVNRLLSLKLPLLQAWSIWDVPLSVAC